MRKSSGLSNSSNLLSFFTFYFPKKTLGERNWWCSSIFRSLKTTKCTLRNIQFGQNVQKLRRSSINEDHSGSVWHRRKYQTTERYARPQISRKQGHLNNFLNCVLKTRQFAFVRFRLQVVCIFRPPPLANYNDSYFHSLVLLPIHGLQSRRRLPHYWTPLPDSPHTKTLLSSIAASLEVGNSVQTGSRLVT